MYGWVRFVDLTKTALSAIGPSRHIAVPREFGRKRRIAEVGGQPSIAEDDARDPERTSYR